MTMRSLVALDGSPSMAESIEVAISAVGRFGGVVTGVAVIDEELLHAGEAVPLGGGGAIRELRADRTRRCREAAERAITEFQAECDRRGVAHRTELREQPFVEAIREASRLQDLVLVGVRRAFDYGVIEHDATQVVDLINAGVRPLLATTIAARLPRRILVACNGSFESGTALRTFVQLFGPIVEQARLITIADRAGDPQSVLDSAEEYLRDHGIEQVDSEIVTEGPVSDVLHTEAHAWGADVIVLGSTGRNWLKRMVMGDSARNLVRTTTVPVFLVH